jgi:hypothetical protein
MPATRPRALIATLLVVAALNAYDALTVTHWLLNTALAVACLVAAVALATRKEN